MEYTKFLTLARNFKGGQSQNEFKFMELLVEQEADMLDWKHPRTPYKSWRDLLRQESLATPSMFENYKKTRELISLKWIEKLGVYPSINIAKLDTRTRGKVLTQVKRWYGNRKVAPNYQLVSAYVKGLKKDSSTTKRQSKIQKMRAYIRTCQALLRDNNIPIPKENIE